MSGAETTFLSPDDFLIIPRKVGGREVAKLLALSLQETLGLTSSILPDFGKGSLITPQGSKQTTLTDVQIASKQPGRRGKQMTEAGRGEAIRREAGLASSHTEIARQRESRRVNVRQPVGHIYSSF